MGHTTQHEAISPTYPAWTFIARQRYNELAHEGRKHCYYVPPVPDLSGYFRTVVVFEGEPGFFCMGVFSKDQAKAERRASEDNQRNGVSEDEATRIVASSLIAQIAEGSKA
jgi:hypothetical protein